MGFVPGRLPKNYDGTGSTTRMVGDVLPIVLTRISDSFHDRPDLILASWPEIIGQQLAPMTHAVSFKDGILLVSVKNSTLHSLLSNYERGKILVSLKKKFPRVKIIKVVFRIG